ncbi:23S rRNA (adenine(2503)-C(2))-methyltransferase RlmN [Akkermansiaceae bacterium]|nr:23S rRNA (adenine(2503)-C(2))-methyltransferase RlmN [Akkermansiaceae bacterium]MDB4436011.1 23S rRNA (adenine(2503)-C(2))-methyltransferase RlmN [Akkermansiaceae bacterium]
MLQADRMITLYDYTFTHLEESLRDEGVKAVHAQDIYRHLYKDSIPLKELTQGSQDWINKRAAPEATVVKDIASSDGYTRKFLFRFDDGQEIETVLMEYRGRYTACISSQVGCAMGCVFCATGKMGFKRHLSAGEMVAQVKFLNTHLASEGKEPLRNIVMMGMGEPLHNFKELIIALEIISDPRGICIAPSRISISTVGHIPAIKKLAEIGKAYELSVSLHGASDEERDALIPVNKRWPIADLLETCQVYSEKTERKVLIAWTLIEGANDSDDHATRLARLLKGRQVHVNLIPLNPTEGFDGRPPSEERILEFQRILQEVADLPVTVRQRRGIDVGAGCGQLAG